MLIQEFAKYYDTRVSNISELFMAASKNGNENAVHDLRVDIKKLRAFFELMKEIGLKSDMKKAFAPIKRLFKSAAAIRDVQVLQTLVREHILNEVSDINLSEYFNLLKQKEMAAKKDFFKFSKTFDLSVFDRNRELINKEISELEESVIEDFSKQYLKHLLDILNELKIRQKLEETDLHEIRILCKKTRYTLEILSVCYSQQDFDTLNNSLRSIHQALGQWHDTDLAILFLKEILSDSSFKPLFSEFSYKIVLKMMEERKQHFYDLFYERFKAIPSASRKQMTSLNYADTNPAVA